MGMIPQLLTMISSEGEQWGRDEIYPDRYIIPYVKCFQVWMDHDGS